MVKANVSLRLQLTRLIAGQTQKLRWELMSEEDKEKLRAKRRQAQIDRARAKEERRRAAIEKAESEQRQVFIEQLRAMFADICTAARGCVFVNEAEHPIFRTVLIVRSRMEVARFDITLGRSGGRIRPGPKFDSHEALLEYLRTEFLVPLAELIAKAQLLNGCQYVDNSEEDDEAKAAWIPEDQEDFDNDDEWEEGDSWDEEDGLPEDEAEYESEPEECSGSYDLVLRRDVGGENADCPICGATFHVDELNEIDDEDGDHEPPRHAKVLGAIPGHVSRYETE